jgi:HSP20 family molecular chaperone IbpA
LDPDKVVARSENGVLKLYLPKAEKERPRRIEIS